MEKQHSGSWKSYIVRPSLVTTGEPIYKFLLGGNYIPKEELAATIVDLAVNGSDQQTLNNAELVVKVCRKMHCYLSSGRD